MLNQPGPVEEKPSSIHNLQKQLSFSLALFRKRKTLCILSLVFLIISIAGISLKTRTSKVTQRPLAIKVFALGRVQPTSYVRSIQYPMVYSSSRIQKLFVRENDIVKKGDPLFTVEDSEEALYNTRASRSLVDQQSAQLRGAEAKLLSAKALRDFYKNQLLRYNFLARKGAATLEQADEKSTLFNAAQQDYEANIQIVKATRSALNSAIWSYRSNSFKSSISTIRAPINARVFRIYSRPGESIQDGKPVMDVGESNAMGVLGEVHKTDIMKVRIGQIVTVTANGIPTIKWKGHVINIGRQVTQQSINSDDPAATLGNQVYDVLIQLDKPYISQAQLYNLMEVNILFEP
jgi:multidrug resistance efflux pump